MKTSNDFKSNRDYKLDKFANNLKKKHLEKKASSKKRIIFHIDVNSAFLSWTAVNLLKNGYSTDIRTIPSAISFHGKRSVILAKSIPAKTLGIKTGESLNFALKKVNNLEIFKPDYKLYEEYSKNLNNLFSKYTYYIEKYSIDESFLDVTDFLFGNTPLELAQKIQKDIFDTFGYTVNIGIGNSKVMAKTASDFKKPNMIHTLYDTEIKTKLWPLPISMLFTLGKKSQEKLKKKNIFKIGDLANYSYSKIIEMLGKNGERLWKYANGIDNSPVFYEKTKPKSISHSETFTEDISNKNILLKNIIDLSIETIERMRKDNLICKTIDIHLRTTDFIDFGKSHTLNSYTDISNIIIDTVKDLFKYIYIDFVDTKNPLNNFKKLKEKNINKKILKENGEIKPIRLVGIGLSNLINKDKKENSFFDILDDKCLEKNKKNKRIDTVVSKLKDKYGKNIITRARCLDTNDHKKEY